MNDLLKEIRTSGKLLQDYCKCVVSAHDEDCNVVYQKAQELEARALQQTIIQSMTGTKPTMYISLAMPSVERHDKLARLGADLGCEWLSPFMFTKGSERGGLCYVKDVSQLTNPKNVNGPMYTRCVSAVRSCCDGRTSVVVYDIGDTLADVEVYISIAKVAGMDIIYINPDDIIIPEFTK